MQYVHITKGFGHGRILENIDFPLIQGIKVGVNGPYIMVNGEGLAGYPQRNFKIRIENKDSILIFDKDGDGETHEMRGHSFMNGISVPTNFGEPIAQPAIVERSLELVRTSMIERFDALKGMTIGVAKGQIRGLVVFGKPGLGKSYEIENALLESNAVIRQNLDLPKEADAENDDDEGEDPFTADLDTNAEVVLPEFYTYEIQKGHISASGLYALFYTNRFRNNIIIFDDSDGLLLDDDSISLLQSALDTTKVRTLNWTVSGRRDELPTNFVFEGSVIFITNNDFEVLAKSNSKHAKRIEAILDRCLYLNLMIDTTREKLVRIDYVSRDLGMLERELRFHNPEITNEDISVATEEILGWIVDNAEKFNQLSLRKVIHLTSLRFTNENWHRIAQFTMLKSVR